MIYKLRYALIIPLYEPSPKVICGCALVICKSESGAVVPMPTLSANLPSPNEPVEVDEPLIFALDPLNSTTPPFDMTKSFLELLQPNDIFLIVVLL